VVAKVEWHQGELYPRVGFIVTNLSRPAERVVKSYNGRGTAEQWIKEGKQALRWTRLSCRAFRDNVVRLQLFALAYNLANFLRSLVLPREVAQFGDRVHQLEAGSDRQAERFEVFVGQPRQDRGVDLGVAERRLVALQPETTQPSPDVHPVPLLGRARPEDTVYPEPSRSASWNGTSGARSRRRSPAKPCVPPSTAAA
jgi:hypothetical protein